ncbi:MAG: hypothetical protein CSA81_01575 [Acidobacteria bacterium]|nr:MAG: hypothetical protein CSA81_01575 [Acidobacteriota bacterium]
MAEKNMVIIKLQAWKHVIAEEYHLALQLLQGPILQKKKHNSETVAIYGACLAIAGNKKKEGIHICKQAALKSPKNANIQFLLGLAFMTAELRGRAVEAFETGLEIDPSHKLINKALEELGRRQRPPIPFLPRSHALNIALGRKIHAMKNR